MQRHAKHFQLVKNLSNTHYILNETYQLSIQHSKNAFIIFHLIRYKYDKTL